MPKRAVGTCRAGCRGVAAAQRCLSVPQGNAVLEDEDVSPTQEDGKRPRSLLSPPLLVRCHRGWPMPCCPLAAPGRAPGVSAAPGLGMNPSRVGHGGDGDSRVAVGTPGHAAGDEWCSGSESLLGNRRQGAARGVPRGLPGAMLRSWPHLAAPPRDAAGAVSTGMSGKEAPGWVFFHCSPPHLPRRSLYISANLSLRSPHVGFCRAGVWSCFPWAVFLFLFFSPVPGVLSQAATCALSAPPASCHALR